MAFDFPDSPTLNQVYQGYIWDGEKWVTQGISSNAVRYDIAQALTAPQQAQARANINVTKKNYLINGAMMISQENGATAGTAIRYCPVDNFYSVFSNAGTQTLQQVASPTPGGSPNRLRVTATVADASVGAGDYSQIVQNIEGLRVADLRFGSAAAKTIILQFGVKTPAGTYCVAIQNMAGNRCYVAEYVISAGEANTDVVKSVTVPGDVTGTWATDSTTGISVNWTLMCGTTGRQTAGAWGTVLYAAGSANQFNFMGTAGNVFELFDVGLYEGTVAPAFQVPDYASELALCQRYWIKVSTVVDTSAAFQALTLPTALRAAPTISGGGAGFTVFTGDLVAYTMYQNTRAVLAIIFNARL